MKSAYIITEESQSSRINEIKEELEEMDIDVNYSESIKRPSNQFLLETWASKIMQKETHSIESSDVVVFDESLSDRFGLYVMLGIALASKDFKYNKIVVIKDENTNKLIGLLKEFKTAKTELIKSVILGDSFEEKFAHQGTFECSDMDLTMFNLVQFLQSQVSIIKFNITDWKNPLASIFLGACYQQGKFVIANAPDKPFYKVLVDEFYE